MALVRKVSYSEICDRPSANSGIVLVSFLHLQLVHEGDSPDAKDIAISNKIEAEVRKALDMMLGRPILDFLVRYFVTKVNWFGSLSLMIC